MRETPGEMLRDKLLPEPIEHLAPNRVKLPGRRGEFLYFGGCDYYRLSHSSVVQQAVRDAVSTSGLNVAASRMTTGNSAALVRLETELAKRFNAPAALVLPTGYTANLAVGQALTGEFTHALVDERAHASLHDAAQFLGARVLKFRHRDPADVIQLVAKQRAGARFILLTDGVFATDGAIAPLDDYRRLLPRTAHLWVDDCHGIGILGQRGEGTHAELGLGRTQLTQTITFSKAFGAYGGGVLCSDALRQKIILRSHIFTGGTPLPPPFVAAIGIALKQLNEPRRQRYRMRIQAFKKSLRDLGFKVAPSPTPIVVIVPRNRRDCSALEQDLWKAGILPPRMNYPGGPAEDYFRFVISSEHTPNDLAKLLKVLQANIPML